MMATQAAAAGRQQLTLMVTLSLLLVLLMLLLLMQLVAAVVAAAAQLVASSSQVSHQRLQHPAALSSSKVRGGTRLIRMGSAHSQLQLSSCVRWTPLSKHCLPLKQQRQGDGSLQLTYRTPQRGVHVRLWQAAQLQLLLLLQLLVHSQHPKCAQALRESLCRNRASCTHSQQRRRRQQTQGAASRVPLILA